MAEKQDPELAAFDLDARPPERNPWDGGPSDPFHGTRCEACGAPRAEGCDDDCPLQQYVGIPKRKPCCGVNAAGYACNCGPSYYVSVTRKELAERESRFLCLEHELMDARNALRELFQAAYEDQVMGVPRTAERLREAIGQAYKYLESVGIKPDELTPCCRCGKPQHEDGSPVTWLCRCNGRVCRQCTLINPGTGAYYDETFCSYECRLAVLSQP